MTDALQRGTDVIERMRSSPLFSARRLVAVVLIALILTLSDMLLLHIAGIETLSELVYETAILAIGSYLGFTLASLFGKPIL